MFDDVYIVFGEESNAVLIAELSDGDERLGFEAIEDVTHFCLG
jgi:hypothetical protein